ncbi:MAG: phosphotriesterase [Pirellulales bacterium]
MNRRDFLGASAALGLAAAYPHAAVAADKSDGKMVRTVLGPVDPARLGMTLMHEHAPLVDWSELYETPAADVEPIREQMLSATAVQLKAFHDSLDPQDGMGAIVECTPIRVGRYPHLLADLARRIPVYLIGCTGFWCEAMAPQHPWAVKWTVDPDGVKKLAKLYIREITEGMEDPSGSWGERFTDIKPGIIKVATSTWLRPSERRCHEAAAIASRETGCPITTHTTDGGGVEEAQLLLSLGVAPDKCIIGHQGNMDDRKHEEADQAHLQIAGLGCYVQFDRVGGDKYSCQKVARQIQRLVAAGHAEQVLVGHDHVPYLYTKYTQSDKPVDGFQANEADFTIVSKQLPAALRDAGLTDQAIRTITIDNPRRVLAF